jgi:hypothetical protein
VARQVDQARRHGVLRWNVLAVAFVTGLFVLAAAWLAGPELFGAKQEQPSRMVRATVTMPAECTAPSPEETVRFELDGRTRNGTLNACGHDQEETIEIAVPANAGAGLIDVRIAATAGGTSGAQRPVGLAMLALSCVAGGVYAFLVARGPRHPALT